MRPIRVLILNRQLDDRTGTETYTCDLASELSKLGHIPMVYTPCLGSIGLELRDKGIAVVNDIDQIPEQPDIIQGHHYIETCLASLYFPQVPAIFVCHDRSSWHSEPPATSTILKYIAVDYHCLDRLIENSIPRSKTQILYNAVNLERFKLRSTPLPDKPQKVLILSNRADYDNYIKPIATACSELGISLNIVGRAVGSFCEKPEEILGQYDVVFAKARCAMEAMACGAAVITCDIPGCNAMVTMKSIGHYRKYNFGMRILTNPVTTGFIKRQLQAYNPKQAGNVTAWIRRNASLGDLARQYITLYKQLIEQGPVSQSPRLLQSQKKLYREICLDLEKYIFDAKYRLPMELGGGLSAKQMAKIVIKKGIRKIGRKLWK